LLRISKSLQRKLRIKKTYRGSFLIEKTSTLLIRSKVLEYSSSPIDFRYR
jgi:hypothetical protein